MEGSDVWLYCEVDTPGTTTAVTWMKDNVELVQDAPHILMRVDFPRFILIVDNFQASDSGTYQCATLLNGEETGLVGSPLTLTSKFLITRNR